MSKTKSVRLQFVVTLVSTTEEHDQFSTAGRYGDLSTHRVGMNLAIRIQGTVDGVTAYLTKRVKFTRCTGLSNGDFYFLGPGIEEDDWCRVIHEKGEVVKSVSPEMFPNAFALIHRERCEIKIAAGQTLSIVAIVTDKVSKAGKAYKQLSRATIVEVSSNIGTWVDPRGPLRIVTDVKTSAGPTLVKFSCGHVAELNNTFSYRVGAEGRCFKCLNAPKQPSS